MNQNDLGQHFTYRRLLKFVAPCILMMIVTSIYSIVDGFFISNFAGKNAFAAVNLIMPVLMALGSFGFMIGTGGSALVAFVLGEGNQERGKQIFSMLTKIIVITGMLITLIGFIFMPQIVRILKGSHLIFKESVLYGRILICGITFFMLQNAYQSFLVTAQKANLGLVISISSGILNIILDFLLVDKLKLGVAGAAAATVISQFVGALVPTLYFMRSNSSLLCFVRNKLDLKVLLKTCSNGMSEMLTNLSASLVGALYNLQLIKIAQENGIAAYGVIMYVSFIFLALYFGYAIGINPVVGFHYGAGNKKELRNVLRKSLVLTGGTAIVMTVVGECFAMPLARLFVGYDQTLCEITGRGMAIYSFVFLVCGFNIFASAFFTGLNNGKVSAIISILRTLVIQVIAIYTLPILWGIDGIWAAVVVAEGLTLLISVFFFVKNKKHYGY